MEASEPWGGAFFKTISIRGAISVDHNPLDRMFWADGPRFLENCILFGVLLLPPYRDFHSFLETHICRN